MVGGVFLGESQVWEGLGLGLPFSKTFDISWFDDFSLLRANPWLKRAQKRIQDSLPKNGWSLVRPKPLPGWLGGSCLDRACVQAVLLCSW